MTKRSTAEGILFTDQYQLTMAQLYFELGIHERQAQFDHFFRRYPHYGDHRAGYCVNAGLASLLDWMAAASFGESEIELMRAMRSRTGRSLFSEPFLSWLCTYGNFSSISLEAIPEGRVVHAYVPLTVVRGPLAIAQILETPLLNILNFQTLIATKAARVRESAGDATVLEFGVRRAHDRGGNAGTRAALIGGADFSSNAGISHLLGYPPKGTHAHSMVQAFLALGMTELDAFQAYADLYPDECLLLVDTLDTLESGVPNALRVFERLRAKGYEPVGVRLDSGDLAYLSTRTARMLDDAGFTEASIVLSNDLDEMKILRIKEGIASEAKRLGLDGDRIVGRLVYGVGTRLITSAGHSALGGVYKLAALQTGRTWEPVTKLSEDPAKTPVPGCKNVWRTYDCRGQASADILTLKDEAPDRMLNGPVQDGAGNSGSAPGALPLRHPWDADIRIELKAEEIARIEPLFAEVLADGRPVGSSPDIEQIRAIRRDDVESLEEGVRDLIDPQPYGVWVSERLWALRDRLLSSIQSAGACRNS